ncbi:uncharacterized protein VTP21DRAFT_8394 [Calcarisporiella thermophila]|uniref:uncharacterized protein n=1 Tax=Calcarisporiella thermophila TaxID=911321 RepID=UPI003744076B
MRVLPFVVLGAIFLAGAEAAKKEDTKKDKAVAAAPKTGAETPVVQGAPLPGDWPVSDQKVKPKPEWLKQVDFSKLPNAPVSSAKGPQCKEGQDQFCAWTCTGCTRNDTDVVKCPKKGDWGLTFDDGPTPFSPKLYDYLNSINQKATLFVIGSRVKEYPDLLRRAYKDGHQIASHTWSHSMMTSLSNEEIVAELKWTEEAIKAAINVTVRYFRPPYGDIDDRVRGIAKQLGYKIIIWNHDTDDWRMAEEKGFDPNWIDGNFTQWEKDAPNMTEGSISLEHDLYAGTVDAAIRNIPGLKKAFNVIPVAQCLADQYPYAEKDIVYNPAGGNATASASAQIPVSSAPASSASIIPSTSKVDAGAIESGKPSKVSSGSGVVKPVLGAISMIIAFALI